MYLPLTLEVYDRLFINSLGFMVVDEIRKHQLGLTRRMNSVSILDFFTPKVFLILIIAGAGQGQLPSLLEGPNFINRGKNVIMCAHKCTKCYPDLLANPVSAPKCT